MTRHPGWLCPSWVQPRGGGTATSSCTRNHTYLSSAATQAVNPSTTCGAWTWNVHPSRGHGSSAVATDRANGSSTVPVFATLAVPTVWWLSSGGVGRTRRRLTTPGDCAGTVTASGTGSKRRRRTPTWLRVHFHGSSTPHSSATRSWSCWAVGRSRSPTRCSWRCTTLNRVSGSGSWPCSGSGTRRGSWIIGYRFMVGLNLRHHQSRLILLIVLTWRSCLKVTSSWTNCLRVWTLQMIKRRQSNLIIWWSDLNQKNQHIQRIWRSNGIPRQ